MKAAFIEQYGGPDVLRYGDLPDPVPAPGEVVIDVHAASVNAADWKVRTGQYEPAKFPLILGRDFSGVVAAVGTGVADLRVGEKRCHRRVVGADVRLDVGRRGLRGDGWPGVAGRRRGGGGARGARG